MTPKEKAKELINRYFLEIEGADTYAFNLPSMNLFIAKKCALIALDGILYALSVPPIQNKGHLLYDGEIDYWQQVKQEIEKL